MMTYYYGPFLGMHVLWWAFWILAIVMIFGFGVPERSRANGNSPLAILRRRLARGDITDSEFNRVREDLLKDEGIASSEYEASVTHASFEGHPMLDGLSLSATWVIFYSACAALYSVAPGAIMTATSKLFHGLSFAQMAAEGTGFGFADYLSVVTVGAVYTFFAGMVWSVIHGFFLRQRAERKLAKVEQENIQRTKLSA